jgi:hypothetical protein
MLVVLDPGFFREEDIHSGDMARRQAASNRLLARLNDANTLLSRPGSRLVVAVDTVAWFDAIYRHEAHAIASAADRPLRQALDRLREHRKAGRTLREVAFTGKMWGVPMMACWPPFGRSWHEELERVLAASVVTAAHDGLPVVFLCHRIEGRNVRDQSSATVELLEVLRWRITVSTRGAPTTVIPCVGRPRHLDVPWTRRTDDRLPDQHGPDLHPYCPPIRWMNSQTRVWGTHQSRPCWVDAQEQWWARPSTGGGYHWDVFLNQVEAARIGLSQINVTQHGAPSGQGQPGDLHHVPRRKQHALRDGSGWRCE